MIYKNERIKEAVEELAEKIQKTLDYCIRVIDDRTPYEITQKKIILKVIEEER